jgi:hypothetical protein
MMLYKGLDFSEKDRIHFIGSSSLLTNKRTFPSWFDLSEIDPLRLYKEPTVLLDFLTRGSIRLR